MTGRNTVIAMKTRKIPTARSMPNVIKDFPVGTLLVADCKLPGMSLTPFETLYYNKLKERVNWFS